MKKALNGTRLLTPPMAVRIAWALTGDFIKKPGSKDIASETRKILISLKDKAEKDDKEREYVNDTVAIVETTMRTLDTIYKGRQLNFEEVDKLRAVNMENIQDSLQFGKNAKDYIKSLPAMAIGSGAGVFTFNEVFSSLPDSVLWGIGLGAAGAGFVVNLWIVRWARGMKQREYMKADNERNMYYEQYLRRVKITLLDLYKAIDRLHAKSFEGHYQLEKPENAASVVEGILRGAEPTTCKFIDKHMREGKITPEMWTRCETGGELAETCAYWDE